ncbi:hypothetical protein WA026_014854 [Henosepilachna vigintioctopunctata]|uniref:Uncharacterized protein n=1 Tax=Henosepilachna vigintioctopunctata TaxID=420089 RepID=A0AAW1V1G0_9CUCU
MKFQVFIGLICLHLIFCYTEVIRKPEGVLKKTFRGKSFHLSYLIQQSNQTVTTIRIVRLIFTDCNSPEKCCNRNYLLIGNRVDQSKFCGNVFSNWMSTNDTDIEVTLEFERGKAELWLEYKARNATQCPNHEFQCATNCYNSDQICDGRFACGDHFDEIGCSGCAPRLAPCDNWSSICFDPVSQKCNGVLDCPRGEDEQGCSASCNSTTLRCSWNRMDKCISEGELCDHKRDCEDGYDERDCLRQYCKSPSFFLCNNGLCINDTLVGNAVDDCGDFSDEMDIMQLVKTCIMAICIVLLTVVFIALVIRWCTTRRDIRRLLQNLPEFPLPSFHGPATDEHRGHHQFGYSESDFRVGGDIYESFIRSRREIDEDGGKNGGGDAVSTARRSGSTNFNNPNEEEEIEIIKALVTLGLPHRMCLGLNDNIVELITANQPDSHKCQLKVDAKSRQNCPIVL